MRSGAVEGLGEKFHQTQGYSVGPTKAALRLVLFTCAFLAHSIDVIAVVEFLVGLVAAVDAGDKLLGPR